MTRVYFPLGLFVQFAAEFLGWQTIKSVCCIPATHAPSILSRLSTLLYKCPGYQQVKCLVMSTSLTWARVRTQLVSSLSPLCRDLESKIRSWMMWDWQLGTLSSQRCQQMYWVSRSCIESLHDLVSRGVMITAACPLPDTQHRVKQSWCFNSVTSSWCSYLFYPTTHKISCPSDSVEMCIGAE